jgi:hypothetical protein
MANSNLTVLALRKWEKTSKSRRREARDKRLVLPNPSEVTNNLLRFLVRRVGKPVYQVKVAFNRGFLPKIPREMRPDAQIWYSQMTSDRGRFFEDDDGILQDNHG